MERCIQEGMSLRGGSTTLVVLASPKLQVIEKLWVIEMYSKPRDRLPKLQEFLWVSCSRK